MLCKRKLKNKKINYQLGVFEGLYVLGLNNFKDLKIKLWNLNSKLKG